MVPPDVKEKLANLSNQQRKVLKKVCEGLEYKQIAADLFISENTVKSHVGNIYIKLGIDHLTATLRKKILLEDYCPAIHELEFPSADQIAEEPEPVPANVMDMVEEDQKSIVLYSKPQIIEIKPDKQPKKKRNGWKWILAIVLVGLIIFGAMKVVEWGNGLLQSIQIQPAQATMNVEEIVRQTIQAQPVYQPTTIPTNTVASLPTATNIPPTPIPTRTPAPKIQLPFADDFSQNFKSIWDLKYANWITTNGRASIIQTENLDTGWAIINDPTLSNYRLKVHVNTPHMSSAAQGETYILIRYDPNRDKQLILSLDYFDFVYWGMTKGLQSSIEPFTDARKYEFSASTDVVIEANGNTFTAWISGQMVGNISISGFENGGVGLGIFCSYTDCPTFSNFELEPIN